MSESVDILLIEDNPTDVELALHALARHGISRRVLVLAAGAEALEYLFCTGRYAHRDITDRPRVILLDLKLPLVDGIEVLRQIRVDRRTRNLPVVVLTTSDEERDIADSYQLGANSYIVKPVDFEQFTAAMRIVGLYWLTLNNSPAGRSSPDREPR